MCWCVSQSYCIILCVPYQSPLQVNKKRHIGNDIVCVVFLDNTEAVFNPTWVRSHFIHSYIVVQHVTGLHGQPMHKVQLYIAVTKVISIGPFTLSVCIGPLTLSVCIEPLTLPVSMQSAWVPTFPMYFSVPPPNNKWQTTFAHTHTHTHTHADSQTAYFIVL